MKKIIILFLFLFCFNSVEVKAQNYMPLVIDSSVWRTNTQGPTFGFPQGSFVTEYFLLGDTIFNSLNYKKLYSRVAYWPNTLPSSISLNEPLYALLREDTANRKVYGIMFQNFGCPINQDTLLYDFNLQIGDTLKQTNNCLNGSDKEVLNITIGNSWLASKTFDLSNGIQMFEGVGSYFGLLELMELSVSGNEVNLIYYCRGNQSNCITVGIKQENLNNQILSIYPNPTNSIFNIEFKSPNQFTVSNFQIFDLTGKIIFIQQLTTTNTQIDVSNYPKGIYFYRITNNKGHSYGKIVIE